MQAGKTVIIQSEKDATRRLFGLKTSIKNFLKKVLEMLLTIKLGAVECASLVTN